MSGENELALVIASDTDEKSSLVADVKRIQKRNGHMRTLWAEFCDLNGDGIRDPSLHEVPFLRNFFEENCTAVDMLCKDAPVAASADVEAARVRASLVNGADIWHALPARWQPLFAEPVKLVYYTQHYDFVSIIRDMLDCPKDVPLSMLHKVERDPDYEPCPPLRQGMLLAGMPLVPEKVGKTKNRNMKDWKASPLYARLQHMYSTFLQEEVLPALQSAFGSQDADFEAVVQATPVLRVVMPSPHFATKQHRDADYGHMAEELNYWVPLTPVSGTNSLFMESFPGAGDFEAFEGGYGDMFRWWGNQCSHYAQPNSTDCTRVSLDFRVIPKCFWDAAEAAGLLESNSDARKRWHGGDMRIGSYYSLERSTPPSSDAPFTFAPETLKH